MQEPRTPNRLDWAPPFTRLESPGQPAMPLARHEFTHDVVALLPESQDGLSATTRARPVPAATA